jgi:hypothetical protein
MSTIHSRAMLVSLSIGMFSPRKTDKSITREVIHQHQASDSAGKFVKQILPEEALEAIKQVQNSARTYHYENTCPWTDEGARILPSVHYMDYVDKMRGFRNKFEAQRDVFLENYDKFKETARLRLAGMFKEDDYPDIESVKGKFTFKTDFLPFPTAADFRVDIAEEEMSALKQQMESRIAEASSAARRDLWLRLETPLKAMAERLSDPDAIFRDTLVTNLKDIVSLIPKLNVTGDQDLERIRRDVQQLTATSADTLRKSPSTRRQTAARANDILATMSGYLCGNEPATAPIELPPEQPVADLIPPPLDCPKIELLPAPSKPLGQGSALPAWRRALGRRSAAV